jgi:hypothetical protein
MMANAVSTIFIYLNWNIRVKAYNDQSEKVKR